MSISYPPHTPMTTFSHQGNYQTPTEHPGFDLLAPLRRWFNQIEFRSSKLAHLICFIIPCTCPFERNITLPLFGKTIHVPPLCKLNPLYNEFVFLRLRALTYLADVCGEDVEKYIC